MILKKDDRFNVVALKQALMRQRITKPRFRWPLTLQQAVDMLSTAYAAEVELRSLQFHDDDFTRANIRSVAEALTAAKPLCGLLLCGNPGNGKTTMMRAFQNATNYLVHLGLLDDDTGLGIYKAGLGIYDARYITTKASDDKLFSTIRERPMLGLEDIGREPTEVLDFGNVLNPVVDLLEYRYSAQLFTFVTTNLTPKEVRKKYGNRIADRFNEMMRVVVFENKSYRSQNNIAK